MKVKGGIEQAKKLIDLGGDWDRRNRLKVYEAQHLITARDVKGAASLLLECVSTFTCTELCSYNDFILYTVVTNVLALPRTTLKKKIVDGPEVRSGSSWFGEAVATISYVSVVCIFLF